MIHNYWLILFISNLFQQNCFHISGVLWTHKNTLAGWRCESLLREIQRVPADWLCPVVSIAALLFVTVLASPCPWKRNVWCIMNPWKSAVQRGGTNWYLIRQYLHWKLLRCFQKDLIRPLNEGTVLLAPRPNFLSLPLGPSFPNVSFRCCTSCSKLERKLGNKPVCHFVF